MTAFLNVILNDGQTTPVAHTFAKKKVGDGTDANSVLAHWEDRATGVQVGFPRISQQLRFPSTSKGGSRTTKVTVKWSIPVLETISNSTVSGILPAPTVAFQNMATIEVVLHERSSRLSRQDLYAYIVNYVAKDEFKLAVLDLDAVQ